MNINTFRTIVLFMLLYLSPFAYSEELSLKELEQRCEEAREAKLAPLREAAIEECAAKPDKTREYCERFYRDFGAGSVTQYGVVRQRMFNDLPECLEFYEAEKKSKSGK